MPETTEPTTMKRVLARVVDRGLNELGGVLVPETIRRPVTFRTNKGGLTPGESTLPGLVLIAGSDMEMIARGVGQLLLKVLRTPEVLWAPLNASHDFGQWSVECVPLVEYMRVMSYSDDAVIRGSGIDPATGEPLRSQP